jgi:hypothetical protein
MNSANSSGDFMTVVGGRHQDYSVIGEEFLRYVEEVAVRHKGEVREAVQKIFREVRYSDEVLPALGAATVFQDEGFHDFLSIDPAQAILLNPHGMRHIAQKLVSRLGKLSSDGDAPFDAMCRGVVHRICRLIRGFTQSLEEARENTKKQAGQ